MISFAYDTKINIKLFTKQSSIGVSTVALHFLRTDGVSARILDKITIYQKHHHQDFSSKGVTLEQ